MNVQSKALRVLGTFGGVLFSILLIVALIGSLVFSVSATITEPESIVTIVKQVDLADHVLNNDSVQQILDQEGIKSEMINELLDSPFFTDTVEVYTEEVVAAIRGQAPDATLTEDIVKQFANEHMDLLIMLARKHMPQSANLTDAQIKGALDKLVDQYSSTLVQALPTGKQVKEMLIESELQKPVELLVSSTVPIVLYTIIGVLAAIIFVCLLHKFRGLLCLGIDALIAAVPLLAVYLVLSNKALITSILGDSASLVASLIAVLTAKLGVYLIVLAIVGVLFIAGYITYTVLMKKKATILPAEAAENDPLPETTESIEVTAPVPAEEG